MATIRAYTTIEQSKRLAKILPIESADMRYGYIAPYDFSDRMYDGGYDEIPYPKDFLKKNPNFSENEYDGEYPCWSLASLVGVLPKEINVLGTIYSVNIHMKNEKWFIDYKCNNEEFVGAYSNIFVDACYEMIIKLNEQKLL